MASLKDLRNRISSVKATQKITKAMQMVAAAKLRRAQEAAEAARPYAERMERMLGSLARAVAGRAGAPGLLAGTGNDEVQLVVVATADRGLCGGFNTNIVREARRQIDARIEAGKQVKILCIGRKGRDQLRRLYGERIIDTIEYNLEQLDDLTIDELDLLRETVDTLIVHVERLKERQSKEE